MLQAELKKPNAKIEEVFKRVQLQVRQKSQGRQIPRESTSLEEDFVFNGTARPAATNDRQRVARFNAEPAQFRLDQLQKATVQATPAASGAGAYQRRIALPDGRRAGNGCGSTVRSRGCGQTEA